MKLQSYLKSLGFKDRDVEVANQSMVHIAASEAASGPLALLFDTLVDRKGARPPAGIPVTIRIARAPRDRSLEDFQRSYEFAMRAHAFAATATAPGPACILGGLRGADVVPKPYCAGLDRSKGWYVMVLARTHGSKPLPSRPLAPYHVAAIERALLTLWILGVSMQAAVPDDVLLNRATGQVSVVNFVRATKVPTWRREEAVAGLTSPDAIARVWTPPAWLSKVTATPAVKAARATAWTWSPRC